MSKETFKHFCDCLYKCAEKIEEELKTNILDTEDLIIKSETIDVKLPLQKVKIYHYNEILQIMNGIKINIKKIVYHDNCIKKLEITRKLSEDEVKNYFAIKSKSTEDLTSTEPVRMRHSRRASSTTLYEYTLSTWEAYLQKKEQQIDVTQTKSTVAKRSAPKTKRKQRKLVSSTFNDILDTENNDDFDIEASSKTNYIQEVDEDEEENCTVSVSSEDEPAVDDLDNNYCSNNDTKPKIVDFTYKKKSIEEDCIRQD